MDPESILHDLTYERGLPRAALAAATERRAEMTPLFLAEIDAWLAADSKTRAEPSAIFFIFHLFGSWGETAAYRPLARLLRAPRQDFDAILGETTETAHRVMASVYDGDPGPLYEIILDPKADEFSRAGMCEALAMLVLLGKLDRAEAARFLAEAFERIQPQGASHVWVGWQSAIAMLGLTGLTDLVRKAFKRGFIERQMMYFSHFEADLAHALKSPGQHPTDPRIRYEPFGDVVEEMAHWHFASEAYLRETERSPEAAIGALFNSGDDWNAPQPFRNPGKKTGRNEPCPCGSGKKYKKCCGR